MSVQHLFWWEIITLKLSKVVGVLSAKVRIWTHWIVWNKSVSLVCQLMFAFFINDFF